MAIRQREYLFSINSYKNPSTVDGKRAIALLLVRLILMDPGADPLHPTMGVGIRRYRYAMNKLEELRKRVENQIETFLPCYQNATVEITINNDKTCNIEITIDDVTYVYDSATAPVPITLTDIKNN